jgi:hypothetical protein
MERMVPQRPACSVYILRYLSTSSYTPPWLL